MDMDIGSRLKTLRKKNGLTLSELASRCELTTGFLSQLENNVSSPSIVTLEDIVEALGTTLKDFFNDAEESKIVFKKDDFFEHKTEDYSIKWVVPDAQKRELEPIIININPHCKSLILQPHDGEEFGFVLKGKAKLIYGKREIAISNGQTFYLEGNKTHYIENKSDDIVSILWISTPPSF